MVNSWKRRRGTALVDTAKGILVTAGRRKVFLLPGGGADKGESRRSATIRELHEETGLRATSSQYLFSYVAKPKRSHGGGHFQDHHKVFLIQAEGQARPRHEIKHVHWYKEGDKIRLSGTTMAIIGEYMKRKHGGTKQTQEAPLPITRRKPRIFLTSDLHLSHANIIKYCNRPFQNVQEMNDTLVQNWNSTVRPNDVVYFLGDLASTNVRHWLKQLNGKIVFIKGNHDRLGNIKSIQHTLLEYDGMRFYLTHDPADVPQEWSGWAIAGHHHNNHPDTFPLVNKQTKRINVSVELTDYRPISIEQIMKLIKE